MLVEVDVSECNRKIDNLFFLILTALFFVTFHFIRIYVIPECSEGPPAILQKCGCGDEGAILNFTLYHGCYVHVLLL